MTSASSSEAFRHAIRPAISMIMQENVNKNSQVKAGNKGEEFPYYALGDEVLAWYRRYLQNEVGNTGGSTCCPQPTFGMPASKGQSDTRRHPDFALFWVKDAKSSCPMFWIEVKPTIARGNTDSGSDLADLEEITFPRYIRQACEQAFFVFRKYPQKKTQRMFLTQGFIFSLLEFDAPTGEDPPAPASAHPAHYDAHPTTSRKRQRTDSDDDIEIILPKPRALYFMEEMLTEDGKGLSGACLQAFVDAVDMEYFGITLDPSSPFKLNNPDSHRPSAETLERAQEVINEAYDGIFKGDMEAAAVMTEEVPSPVPQGLGSRAYVPPVNFQTPPQREMRTRNAAAGPRIRSDVDHGRNAAPHSASTVHDNDNPLSLMFARMSVSPPVNTGQGASTRAEFATPPTQVQSEDPFDSSPLTPMSSPASPTSPGSPSAGRLERIKAGRLGSKGT
ncbi:hypothetical protein BV25DRAFT_1829984 [Artomyces pyxidatus]|uniref:Uncharacterized protein n=1 Tax=Artomyces pyxidatus TaxID=48021 RepID=A0ACB8SRR1_9AGAM|nr:hypothetical protein BV25DRAFT_1829984 [Artomyces pyxidatus]